MKLSTAWDGYYALTGKWSDSVRQLSFGGIALLWTVRARTEAVIPKSIAPAAFFFALALVLDLLHYVVAATKWENLIADVERRRVPSKPPKRTEWAPSRLRRRGGGDVRSESAGIDREDADVSADAEFSAPQNINSAAQYFLKLKTVAVLLGYLVLGIYLITRVFE